MSFSPSIPRFAVNRLDDRTRPFILTVAVFVVVQLSCHASTVSPRNGRRAPPNTSLAHQRREWEAHASRTPLPENVEIRTATIGKIFGLVVTPVDPATKLLLIHLHGGGFTMGSPLTHRVLAAHLALATHAQVVLPAYRLAPEHPFPAARDDALATYRWALDQGYAGEEIVWVGDSAGAHIALTAALEVPNLGLPMPRALVLLSPWLDLTVSDPSMAHRANTDPALTRSELLESAAHYLQGMDARAPALDPLARDLRLLPPLLVHVGAGEILRSDAERLAARARAVKVPVTLKTWPGVDHVFHAAAPEVPEANQALAEIGDFVRQPPARVDP